MFDMAAINQFFFFFISTMGFLFFLSFFLPQEDISKKLDSPHFPPPIWYSSILYHLKILLYAV